MIPGVPQNPSPSKRHHTSCRCWAAASAQTFRPTLNTAGLVKKFSRSNGKRGFMRVGKPGDLTYYRLRTISPWHPELVLFVARGGRALGNSPQASLALAPHRICTANHLGPLCGPGGGCTPSGGRGTGRTWREHAQCTENKKREKTNRRPHEAGARARPCTPNCNSSIPWALPGKEVKGERERERERERPPQAP